MKLLANVISAVSSPPLIAIPFTYAVVYRTSSNSIYSFYWTFVSSLFVLVVCLFVLYGVKTGKYTNFDVSKREQRGSIFVFAAIMTTLYIVLIRYFNGPGVLLYSLLGLLASVLIAAAINTKIKASIHMAVFCAFSLTLGIMYGGIFWLVILFAPFVAWSRITLKRHLPIETAVGSALGVFIVIFLYAVVKYFIAK